jgi:hypothetical protein
MSRSAVRVRSSALYFACKFRKNWGACAVCIGALAAVNYPKASSLALARYKCVQSSAGGVGEPPGVDSLTDVAEFLQVRHCRKSFARVPIMSVFSDVLLY